MEKISIHRNIYLLCIFVLIIFVGQSGVGVASINQHSPSVSDTVYLPVVLHRIAAEEYQLPFWIEIAALYQVSPGAGQLAEPVMSHTEWLAYLEEAFPTLIEALVDSGARGTRIYLNWSEIEPVAPISGQPQYDSYMWTYYDDRLREIGEAGIEMLVTIAGPPDWAVDNGEGVPTCGPIYDHRLDEFARFLTDVVNRYKLPPYNVKQWELINEPDYTWLDGGFGHGCWGYDGDDYTNMLSVAYPAIKAADPDALVIQGGVAHDWFVEYGGPFNRYFPDTVMQAGGGAYLDALNFHYFPVFHAEWERWDPNSEDRKNGWLPAPTCGDYFDGIGQTYEAGGIDLIAKASHYRNRMKTCFGLDQPVWLTELGEHGYPDVPGSLAKQARYVIQGNVRGLAAGITNIVWYALATPNDDFEQGLLLDDFSPKPAFYTYKTMKAELDGFSYHHTIDITDVEAYVFMSVYNQEKVVAWGSGALTFSPANQLHIVDREGIETLIVDGGPGDSDGIQNSIIVYQASIEPVFIQVDK